MKDELYKLAETAIMNDEALSEEASNFKNCYPMAWKMTRAIVKEAHELGVARYAEVYREMGIPAMGPHAVTLVGEYVIDASNFDRQGIRVQTMDEFTEEWNVSVVDEFTFDRGIKAMFPACEWGPWSDKVRARMDEEIEHLFEKTQKEV